MVIFLFSCMQLAVEMWCQEHPAVGNSEVSLIQRHFMRNCKGLLVTGRKKNNRGLFNIF